MLYCSHTSHRRGKRLRNEKEANANSICVFCLDRSSSALFKRTTNSDERDLRRIPSLPTFTWALSVVISSFARKSHTKPENRTSFQTLFLSSCRNLTIVRSTLITSVIRRSLIDTPTYPTVVHQKLVKPSEIKFTRFPTCILKFPDTASFFSGPTIFHAPKPAPLTTPLENTSTTPLAV